MSALLNRDRVIQILSDHKDDLKGFKVKSLEIFGSVARDQARPDSDLDLLVEFESSVGLFEFIRLKNYLESLFGRKVDLVPKDSIKRQFREQILKEAVRAA